MNARLKQVRNALGLTQGEMGAHFGLSNAHYSQIEKGIKNLLPKHLEKGAETLPDSALRFIKGESSKIELDADGLSDPDTDATAQVLRAMATSPAAIAGWLHSATPADAVRAMVALKRRIVDLEERLAEKEQALSAMKDSLLAAKDAIIVLQGHQEAAEKPDRANEV